LGDGALITGRSVGFGRSGAFGNRFGDRGRFGRRGFGYGFAGYDYGYGYPYDYGYGDDEYGGGECNLRQSWQGGYSHLVRTCY
jgi:hypothetical protein